MVLERKSLQADGKSFRFKASFSPCLILEILRNDLHAIQSELSEIKEKTPRFFTGSAVVMDLEKITASETLDFLALKQLLQTNGLVPVGVRGGHEEQQNAALLAGLPAMQQGKSSSLELIQNKPDPLPESTKVVTAPIRSGMQIHAKDGDLIVIAQVSPGAELVAAGHIHVYGALHGRALAGAYGNKSARIFCRTLEAELVSIADLYMTKEEISFAPTSSTMIQIYLENESLQIMSL